MNPTPDAKALKSFFAPYLVSLSLWFSFEVVIAAYYVSMEIPISVRLGFWRFLFQMFLVLIPFALLTPITFKASQKLYETSRHRAQWFSYHLGLCLLWYVLANGLASPYELAFWRPHDARWWDVILDARLNQFLVSVLSFWAIAAAATTTSAFGERNQREMALSKVQAQLSEAKIQNLRDKLNPHFLFNSLNSAVSFVRTGENGKAEDLLLALAELMDRALAAETPLAWSLATELDMADKVLEIAAIRFGEKLNVSLQIAPETSKVQIPSMLLQPLVENAITHGLAQGNGTGSLNIRTEILDQYLVIELKNDLADSSEPTPGHGLGLSLTRARVTAIYGDQARFCQEQDQHSFRIELRIPLELEPCGS